MELSTLQIILICLLTAFGLVIWTLRSPTPTLAQEDHFLNEVGDFVSTGAFVLADYSAYVSNLLAFVPGQKTTSNMILFPKPTSTWLSSHEAHKKQLCIDTINKFFTTPFTIYVFTENNFQGKLVMIPFEPIPVGQKIYMSAAQPAHSALFQMHLVLPSSTKTVFSCVVPKDHKVSFGFDVSNAEPLVLIEGAHPTIICYNSIFSITIQLATPELTTTQIPQVEKK